MRHSQRWLRAAGIAVAALLLGVATAGFLQTHLAFRLVWRPVVSLVLPGTLEVRSGRLRWPGRVEADGVAWEAPELGIALAAERLQLTLVRDDGRLTTLDLGSLEVHRATLALRSAAVDPEPEPRAEEDAPHRVVVPLFADRIRATDLTVTWGRAAKTLVRFGPGALAASRLRPEANASLRLAGPVEIAPDTPERAYAGLADLDGALDLTGTGEIRSWAGRGRASLSRASGEIRPPLLTYAFDLRGGSRSDADGFASIRAEGSLSAREGTAAAGDVTGVLRLRESERGRLDAIRVDLELQDLTERFLDPLLAPVLGSALASARLDGRVRIETRGDNVRSVTRLRGADWRLESHPTAPPLGFEVSQRATYAMGAGMLDLESVEATLDDGPARLATLRLRRPLRLFLNGRRPAPGTQQSIGVDATLDGPLQDLQPWLAALELPLTGLRRGRIASELHLEIPSDASAIDVRGRLGLRGVELDVAALERGPYELRSELDARLVEFDSLILTRAPLTLSLRGEPVLQAELEGRLGGGDPAVALDARIERLHWRGLALSQGVVLLRHAAGNTRIELERGRLLEGAATGAWLLAEDAGRWSVEIVNARLPLALAALERPVPAGSDSRLRLATEGSWQLVEQALAIDRLDAAITDRGSPLASARLTAPLALDLDDDRVTGAGAGPVRLEIRLGEAPLAEFRPWLGLLGLPLVEAATGGRLASELELVADPAANRTAISGLLSLRDVELGERAPHPGPFTLRAELAAELDGLHQLALEQTPVHLSVGETPILACRIRGRIGQEGAAGGALRAELEADLERLGWGEAQLEEGRVTLRHESGATHATLARARLAGGQLTGSATVRSLPQERQVTWQLEGAEIQVAPLIRALQPDEAPRLEGTLRVASQGTGAAAAEASLLEAAEGQLDFEIADATVRRSILLSLLTDWMRVASASDGRFRQIRGALALEGGLARIREMEAVGPTGKLRFRGGLDLVNGQMDVVVVARIGPDLAERLGPAQRLGLDWAVGRAQDLATLPVDVRITGPLVAPEYQLRARGTGTVERVVQGGGGVLRGTARGTTQAVGGGSRWVRDTVGGLLRRGGGDPDAPADAGAGEEPSPEPP